MVNACTAPGYSGLFLGLAVGSLLTTVWLTCNAQRLSYHAFNLLTGDSYHALNLLTRDSYHAFNLSTRDSYHALNLSTRESVVNV